LIASYLVFEDFSRESMSFAAREVSESNAAR
jgi:hypothetical protein